MESLDERSYGSGPGLGLQRRDDQPQGGALAILAPALAFNLPSLVLALAPCTLLEPRGLIVCYHANHFQQIGTSARRTVFYEYLLHSHNWFLTRTDRDQ